MGKSRAVRSGKDLTLVAWGNTVPLCEKVADALAAVDCHAEVIDLRWLSPWDADAVAKSVRETRKMIVVHEDNRTAGFGAEVIATVSENVSGAAEYRRITRPDTYVPCNFSNQLEVLPSFESILTEAAKMLDLELTWPFRETSEEGMVVVEAVGSSPSDQTVTILDLMVKPGQTIAAGDVVACIGCDKALVEFCAPISGVVETVHLQEGQETPVGAPLITIRTEANRTHHRQTVRETCGEPHLVRKAAAPAKSVAPLMETTPNIAALSGVYRSVGTEAITNADITVNFPEMTEHDIFVRTGIESRVKASPEQSALSMAADAARQAIAGEGIRLEDIDLIICSTSTPQTISPSMACLVLHQLNRDQEIVREIPAYDILAACTGYLYALKAAWDHVQTSPNSRVLVLTTEHMSSIVDPKDFGTVVVFGDAATATIVSGVNHMASAKARLFKPNLSAHGEDGTALSVPVGPDRAVRMNGKTIFAEAVRRMVKILEIACQEQGHVVADLDVVIPHQANGRITDAVSKRLKVRPGVMRDNIIHLGNTSSSTIPLALVDELNGAPNRLIGLCAFGAGYTFAGALIETL